MTDTEREISRRTELRAAFDARICKCGFCRLSYRTRLIWDELPFEAKQLVEELHDAWGSDSLDDGMKNARLWDRIEELEEELYRLKADR